MSSDKLNAIISGRAQVALLVAGNTLKSIHIDALDVAVDRKPEEYHLLFGESDDLEFLEDVKIDEIRRRLTSAVDREEALDLTLILLDSELSEAVRSDAAGELEKLLQNEQTVEQLERVFFAKPLPESADHQGAGAYLKATSSQVASAFLQRLVDSQPRIRNVRGAWEAIGESKFGSGTERDVVAAHFVRNGLFRDLVSVPNATEAIDNFRQRIAATALDTHQVNEILREWISIFQHLTNVHRSKPIFISHATADDAFVQELRHALEGQNLKVWVDSRELVGGQQLAPEIEQAIETARQFIVVLSPAAINSEWVRLEIEKAKAVEQHRVDDGYRAIPVLLPGVTPTAVKLWFGDDRLGIEIRNEPSELSEALPQILDALGERLPTDLDDQKQIETQPVEELVLSLQDAKIEELGEGVRRATATSTLVYQPAKPGARPVESRRFTFTAPLGPIEADDLRWYLESYASWPTGVFKDRAQRIEAQLPKWGQDLYHAALGAQTAQDALNAWRGVADGTNRRFSVSVDPDVPEGSSTEQAAETKEAATRLLALPWELIHDSRSYLFQVALDPAKRG